MPNSLTYFAILVGSILGPLLLSFDKKVSFYQRWGSLFKAMLFPALFYIIWDICFTKMGVWSFHDKYITGLKFYNLPIEEILFFFVVPYCCVFIYQCIRIYFPTLQSSHFSKWILNVLAIILLMLAIFHHERAYTFFTCLFLGAFIFFVHTQKSIYFNSTAFLISYLLILIPFLIINGLLTSIPVVLYNDTENLSFRIFTIPVEDVFYGMLLIMMNVVGYEKWNNSKKL